MICVVIDFGFLELVAAEILSTPNKTIPSMHEIYLYIGCNASHDDINSIIFLHYTFAKYSVHTVGRLPFVFEDDLILFYLIRNSPMTFHHRHLPPAPSPTSRLIQIAVPK